MQALGRLERRLVVNYPGLALKARRVSRGTVRRVLGVPIFYKVLVANSAIVILGAVFGTWITVQYGRFEPDRSSGELVAAFALVGITLTVLVNFMVLKAAFLP